MQGPETLEHSRAVGRRRTPYPSVRAETLQIAGRCELIEVMMLSNFSCILRSDFSDIEVRQRVAQIREERLLVGEAL